MLVITATRTMEAPRRGGSARAVEERGCRKARPGYFQIGRRADICMARVAESRIRVVRGGADDGRGSPARETAAGRHSSASKESPWKRTSPVAKTSPWKRNSPTAKESPWKRNSPAAKESPSRRLSSPHKMTPHKTTPRKSTPPRNVTLREDRLPSPFDAYAERSSSHTSADDEWARTTRPRARLLSETRSPRAVVSSNSDIDMEDTSAAGSDEYEVEALRGRRRTRRGVEYLVKWKGYGEDESTWEPEHMMNCAELIAAYDAAHPAVAPTGRRAARPLPAAKTPRDAVSVSESVSESDAEGNAGRSRMRRSARVSPSVRTTRRTAALKAERRAPGRPLKTAPAVRSARRGTEPSPKPSPKHSPKRSSKKGAPEVEPERTAARYSWDAHVQRVERMYRDASNTLKVELALRDGAGIRTCRAEDAYRLCPTAMCIYFGSRLQFSAAQTPARADNSS